MNQNELFFPCRVHSRGLRALLLHLQHLEGTITVLGGSLCDARLQRYKNATSSTSKMLCKFHFSSSKFLSAGNGIGKALLSKVAEVRMRLLTTPLSCCSWHCCPCCFNCRLAYCAQVGKTKQCVKLQLSVLDWNTAARDFYKSQGAEDLTVSEGWHVIRFMDQSLENLASEAPQD